MYPMIWTSAIVTLCFIVTRVQCLSCYQGIMSRDNSTLPPTIECPNGYTSCSKVVDSNTINRQCSWGNCTLGGVYSSGYCENNTLTLLCCCHGDNCNGSTMTKSSALVIAFGVLFYSCFLQKLL